jgi:hypothetical protein
MAALACAGGPPTASAPRRARPAPITLRVTTLQDYGPHQPPIPGSLREAIARASGPCTIRFAVGGAIQLRNKLTIDKPYLAIDGAGAPGEGITLQRWQVEVVNTHHVVLRFLRIRSGDGFPADAERRKVHGQYDKDPAAGGSGGWRSLVIAGDRPEPTRDILVEHCSIQNATDDNATVWGNCRAVTFRGCIFSGGHVKASKGLLAGAPAGRPPPDYPDWLTIDHCLFADVAIRTPDLAGGVCHLVNNVIVAPLQGARLTNARANILNNCFFTMKDHPWGDKADRLLTADPRRVRNDSLYVAGNLLDGRPVDAGRLLGWMNQAQTGLPATIFRTRAWPSPASSTTAPAETATPAASALREVLDTAGCSRPRRDAQDQRVVSAAARAAGQDPPPRAPPRP